MFFYLEDRERTLDSPTDFDASGTTGTETHPLAETGKEAGQRAGQLVERGAQIGITQADRGLDQAATGVESVADSIRRVSADMESDQPQIAEFALTAANQAEATPQGEAAATEAGQVDGAEKPKKKKRKAAKVKPAEPKPSIPFFTR